MGRPRKGPEMEPLLPDGEHVDLTPGISATSPVNEPHEEPDDLEMTEGEAVFADFDSWINQWDWSTNNYTCKVKRMMPTTIRVGSETVAVNGLLEERPGVPFTEREIGERFGGKIYEVIVSGPRKRDGKYSALAHRQVTVPGDPRMAPDAMSPQMWDTLKPKLENAGMLMESSGFRPSFTPSMSAPPRPRPGYTERPGFSPPPDFGERRYVQPPLMRPTPTGDDAPAIVNAVSAGFRELTQTAQKSAREIAESAIAERENIVDIQRRVFDSSTKSTQDMLNRIEEEKKQLQAEVARLRDATEKMQRDHAESLRKMQDESDKRLQSVVRENSGSVTKGYELGTTLLTALMPQAQENAKQQVAAVTQSYENRITALQSEHKATLENERTRFERLIDEERRRMSEEIKYLREARDRDVKSLSDGREREVKDLNDKYERDMTIARNSYENNIKALREGYERELSVQRDLMRSEKEERVRVLTQVDSLRTEALRLLETNASKSAEAAAANAQLQLHSANKTDAGFAELAKQVQSINALKGLFGVGGAEPAAAAAPESQTQILINKALEVAGNAIPHVAQAIAARRSEPAPAPAPMPQVPQFQQPPSVVQAPPMQRMAPRPMVASRQASRPMASGTAPRPVAPVQSYDPLQPAPSPAPPTTSATPAPSQAIAPVPPQRPKIALNRGVIRKALESLQGILDSPTPPAPTVVALSLSSSADVETRRMLTGLKKANLSKLLAQLESEKLLPAKIATEEGKTYLRDMIAAWPDQA